MALLADTSVWSLAFRRDTPRNVPEVVVLRDALLGGEEVVTVGVVLLELLRGSVPQRTRDGIQFAFDRLRFVEPTRDDYPAAAALSNACRSAGIQLATVDALIAQVCIANDLVLLTTDADFTHASEHVPLRVWSS